MLFCFVRSSRVSTKLHDQRTDIERRLERFERMNLVGIILDNDYAGPQITMFAGCVIRGVLSSIGQKDRFRLPNSHQHSYSNPVKIGRLGKMH